MKITPLAPLFLITIVLTLIFPFLICPVQAEDDIDFSAIPEKLAEQLNIPLLAGQILISAIFLLMWILPVTIITRSKHASFVPEVASTLLILGFCIAVGWLEVFFIIILCLVIALMFAGKMRDLITGSEGK